VKHFTTTLLLGKADIRRRIHSIWVNTWIRKLFHHGMFNMMSMSTKSSLELIALICSGT
jgi:hypothetical protein